MAAIKNKTFFLLVVSIFVFGFIAADVYAATFYRDKDGDSYGDINNYLVRDKQPKGYVTNSLDCRDNDKKINPAAIEKCGDKKDNNCDGKVDENCALNTYYRDADGDTYGSPTSTTTATTAPTGYVSNKLDCNDANAAIHLGAAEICGNSIDEDCSGADLACALPAYTYYQDADADGYGGMQTTQATSLPFGYSAATGDCNDANANINPFATEICNGVDDNCASGADENNICSTISSCGSYGNACPTDTNGAASCTNGICSLACNTGYALENNVCKLLNIYYGDADGDTYGDAFATTTSTSQPIGYVSNSLDCNDGAANVHPGVAEICGNGIDEDCSGADLACPIINITTTTCTPTNSGVEICGNNIDEDCSGADLACPITTNATTTTPTISLINCADTDGGLDYYTAGTCTNRYGTQYVDKCLTTTSGVQLYEYYCSTDAVDCSATLHSESGYDCANGKLVPQTTTTACTDTDGGKLYTTKGTCTDSTGSYTDSCPYSAWVKEYYCTSAGCASVDNTAIDYSCSDGALYATSTSAPDLTATCTDSDGINYKTKGTCTYGSATYTDYCSGSLVMDYYCISSGCSTNSYKTTASLGESCVDGTLVKCTPTNSGVEICGNGIDEDCSGSDLACPVTCTPSWTCTGWSICADGQETRICTDSNNCGTTDGKPGETQSCTPAIVNTTTGAAVINTPNGLARFLFGLFGMKL